MRESYALLKRCIIASTLFAITFVYACKKDSAGIGNDIDKEDLTEMLAWFKVNVKTGSGNPFASMEPRWESVYRNDQGEHQVYEFELTNSKHIFQAGSIAKKGMENKYLGKNKIRLLIFMDRVSHKISYGAYMSIIDDSDAKNLHSLQYKSCTGLTGEVLFYSLSGAFVNGWKYSGGSVINSISPISEGEFINMQLELMSSKTTATKSTREKFQKEAYDSCLMGIPSYAEFCFQIDGYAPRCG